MYENIRITWFGVSAVVSGLLFYALIDSVIEPWVIETFCRELLKCE